MKWDRPILVVGYRLSTGMNARRIYAMDDGEIVELFNHEEIISKGDVYTKPYSTQVLSNGNSRSDV